MHTQAKRVAIKLPPNSRQLLIDFLKEPKTTAQIHEIIPPLIAYVMLKELIDERVIKEKYCGVYQASSKPDDLKNKSLV